MLQSAIRQSFRKNLASALFALCAAGLHSTALSADVTSTVQRPADLPALAMQAPPVALPGTAEISERGITQVDSKAQGKSAVDIPALTIVCWHDVRDQLIDGFAKNPDTTAVDTRDLIAQFELIRDLGYTPVSLEQWMKGRDGLLTLPAKPILLTFDDGYRSFHDKVLPLLRLYGYPAVAAIVSDWIQPDEQTVQGPRKFMTRSELQAVQRSGLVEIASHSHDLHRGVLANPQGNEQPAANVRAWLGDRYESDDSYVARIRSDLKQSAQSIEAVTGVRPRTVVWPYGAYNHLAAEAAMAEGYHAAMSLESGLNQAQGSPMQMRRLLVETAMGLTDFARALIPAEVAFEVVADHHSVSHRASAAALELGTMRSLRISLDSVYHPDASLQEQRLSELLEQVRKLGVNTVMLEALSTRDDAGNKVQAYFPNTLLPVKADLFNRVSWQLRTRAEVKVFAVLPLAALDSADAAQATGFARELGRHVPMAGLVIDSTGQSRADISTSRDRALQLTAQVRVYHPELLTVLQMDSTRTLAQKAAVWTAALEGFDFLMLSRHDALDAQDPRLSEEQLRALSRTRHLELVGTLESHALIDRIIVSSARPAEQLGDLMASPIRHLAVDMRDLPDAPQALLALRPMLSTATRHNPRK